MVTDLLERVFHNPYHYSATLLAKLSVNIATILWSVVVLLKTDALGPFYSYRVLISVMDEDYWAILMLTISSTLFYRLIRCYPPRRVGAIGYVLIGGLWSNIWWGIVIQPGPFWPAAFGSVTVILVLALFAFIANPKRRGD